MDDPLRALAQGCLPEGAFLRRDRGRALYVARADERARAALEQAGFAANARGELLEITPTPALLPVLRAAFPAPEGDALCAQLNRLALRPVSTQELSLLCEALKGPGPAFEKRLRQCAAVCLRTGTGGALGACRAIQLSFSPDTPDKEVKT